MMQGAFFLCLLSFWAKQKESKSPSEGEIKASSKLKKLV
jgi:hypothetical protein